MTITSRRERLRAATIDEIRQAARAQLLRYGPTGISLRAVARELGMTPAGLYRYFPGLDALVQDLGACCHQELAGAVVAGRDAVPAEDPAGRLLAACRAFRTWSVAHPAEFALMFGGPVPGLTGRDAGSVVQTAGVAFSTTFAEAFLALLRQGEAGTPTDPLVDPALVARVHEVTNVTAAPLQEALRPEAFALFLSGWIRLYGIVAMEVFGQLRWAVTDAEPLFEAELADLMQRLTRQ
ncbi:MAG TPA: TetR/AcrR family transcriptional regulator [Micromonosporaceae bacterium]|nr:TetR/AcrR family transcriptional regulator [Micromonosporaceae bacterium]